MNKKQKLQKKILELERYIKSVEKDIAKAQDHLKDVEKDIANITKHIKKCKESLQTLKNIALEESKNLSQDEDSKKQ